MKYDALWIQNKLKNEGSCSVAMLMHWCDLDYPQAVALLRQLIGRGWLAEQAQGSCYLVQPENLQLRKLRRPEAERLYPQLTRKQIRVLLCIADGGADLEQLHKTVRGVIDLPDVVEELCHIRLIHCCNSRYYLRISKSAAQLLGRLLVARPERLVDREQVSDQELWQRRAQKLLDEYYGAA